MYLPAPPEARASAPAASRDALPQPNDAQCGREFRTSDAAAWRELGNVGKTSLADGLRLYLVAHLASA